MAENVSPTPASGEYAIRISEPGHYKAQPMNLFRKVERFFYKDRYVGPDDLWKIQATVNEIYSSNKPHDEQKNDLGEIEQVLKTVHYTTDENLKYAIKDLERRIEAAISVVTGPERASEEGEPEYVAEKLVRSLASKGPMSDLDPLRTLVNGVKDPGLNKTSMAPLVSQKLILPTALKLSEELKRKPTDQHACDELLLRLATYCDNFVKVFGLNWLPHLCLHRQKEEVVQALFLQAITLGKKDLVASFWALRKDSDFRWVDTVMENKRSAAKNGDEGARQLVGSFVKMMSDGARTDIQEGGGPKAALNDVKANLLEASNIWKDSKTASGKEALVSAWLTLYEAEYKQILQLHEPSTDTSLEKFITAKLEGHQVLSEGDTSQIVSRLLPLVIATKDDDLVLEAACEYPQEALKALSGRGPFLKREWQQAGIKGESVKGQLFPEVEKEGAWLDGLKAITYCKELIDKIYTEEGDAGWKEILHFGQVQQMLKSVFPQIEQKVGGIAETAADSTTKVDRPKEKWKLHCDTVLGQIVREGNEKKAKALIEQLREERQSIKELLPSTPESAFSSPPRMLEALLIKQIPTEEGGARWKDILYYGRVQQMLTSVFPQSEQGMIEAADSETQAQLKEKWKIHCGPVLEQIVREKDKKKTETLIQQLKDEEHALKEALPSIPGSVFSSPIGTIGNLLIEKIFGQLPLDTEDKKNKIRERLRQFHTIIIEFPLSEPEPITTDFVEKYGQEIANILIEGSKYGKEPNYHETFSQSTNLITFLRAATEPLSKDVIDQCFKVYADKTFKKISETQDLNDRLMLWRKFLEDADRMKNFICGPSFSAGISAAIAQSTSAQGELRKVMNELRNAIDQRLEGGRYLEAETLMKEGLELRYQLLQIGRDLPEELVMACRPGAVWSSSIDTLAKYGRFLGDKIVSLSPGYDEESVFERLSRIEFMLGEEASKTILDHITQRYPSDRGYWEKAALRDVKNLQQAILDGDAEREDKITGRLKFYALLGEPIASVVRSSMETALAKSWQDLCTFIALEGHGIADWLTSRYGQIRERMMRSLPGMSEDAMVKIENNAQMTPLGKALNEQGKAQADSIIAAPSEKQWPMLKEAFEKWRQTPYLGWIAMRSIIETLKADLNNDWGPALKKYCENIEAQKKVYKDIPRRVAEYKAVEKAFLAEELYRSEGRRLYESIQQKEKAEPSQNSAQWQRRVDEAMKQLVHNYPLLSDMATLKRAVLVYPVLERMKGALDACREKELPKDWQDRLWEAASAYNSITNAEDEILNQLLDRCEPGFLKFVESMFQGRRFVSKRSPIEEKHAECLTKAYDRSQYTKEEINGWVAQCSSQALKNTFGRVFEKENTIKVGSEYIKGGEGESPDGQLANTYHLWKSLVNYYTLQLCPPQMVEKERKEMVEKEREEKEAKIRTMVTQLMTRLTAERSLGDLLGPLGELIGGMSKGRTIVVPTQQPTWAGGYEFTVDDQGNAACTHTSLVKACYEEKGEVADHFAMFTSTVSVPLDMHGEILEEVLQTTPVSKDGLPIQTADNVRSMGS